MSGALADEVFRREVPPGSSRDVLIFYALCAKADGTEARPTIRTTAAVNSLSERTTQRLVKSWRDKGVLELQHPGRRLDKDTYLAAVYSVNLTAIPWREGQEPGKRRGAKRVRGVSPLQAEVGVTDQEVGVTDSGVGVTELGTNVNHQRPSQRPSQRPKSENEKKDSPRSNPAALVGSIGRGAKFAGEPKPIRCRVPDCGRYNQRRTYCADHPLSVVKAILEEAAKDV